jgi:hypothetical protein
VKKQDSPIMNYAAVIVIVIVVAETLPNKVKEITLITKVNTYGMHTHGWSK